MGTRTHVIDGSRLAEIINAVPDNWISCFGYLQSSDPEALEDSTWTIENHGPTGLKGPMIDNLVVVGQLLSRRAVPKHVNIGRLLEDVHGASLIPGMKKLAIELIGSGYCGNMFFEDGLIAREEFISVASCQITVRKFAPPFVKLTWASYEGNDRCNLGYNRVKEIDLLCRQASIKKETKTKK